MNTIFSPSNIEVLLHCHVNPGPHPRIDAPAVRQALQQFFSVGAIFAHEDDPPGVFRTTSLGDAWVQALCNVPPPRQVFVDERGRLL